MSISWLRNKTFVFLSCGVVFLIIRILFLTKLPIFNDESIYLRWGQAFHDNPYLWSFPIWFDGKLPGLTMLFGFLQWLPIDPLVTGRLLSVMFSLVTWYVLLLLAKPYSEKTGGTIVLTILYALCPLAFFFERMALMESAVIMVHVVSAFLFFRLLEKPTIVRGALLGLLLVFGFWIKTIVLLTMLCVGVGMIYHIRRDETVWKRYRAALMTIGGVFCLGILPLLLQQAFWHMGEKSAWTLTLEDFLSFPIRYWWTNVVRLLFWSIEFLTPLYLIAAIIGIPIVRKTSRGIYILIWAVVPLIVELFVAKIFTTRYMALVVPFWVLFAFVGIETYSGRVKKVIWAVTIFFSGVTTLVLAGMPLLYYALIRAIPYAHEDFSQYVLSWHSGYGITSAIRYIEKYEKEHGKTLVIVRGDSGNPEDAVYLYLSRYGMPVVFNDEFIKNADKFIPTYAPNILFVSRGDRYAEFGKYTYELVRFRKPLDDEFVGIYQLKL